MRLRNIPGADEVIRNCDWVIKEPADKKGKWNTVFGNENPIHIEVGMGKGQFITEMAMRNPAMRRQIGSVTTGHSPDKNQRSRDFRKRNGIVSGCYAIICAVGRCWEAEGWE